MSVLSAIGGVVWVQFDDRPGPLHIISEFVDSMMGVARLDCEGLAGRGG